VKDIAKAYKHLSADERFRLFMEAATRKDDQEMDRLNNSCPRKTYLCDDDEYTKRKTRFMFLALVYSHELGRLEVLAYLALATCIAQEGDEYPEKAAQADDCFDLFLKVMQMRAAKNEAWRRFCHELGFLDAPPEYFGAEEAPSIMLLAEEVAKLHGELTPEPKVLETTLAAMREGWSSIAT